MSHVFMWFMSLAFLLFFFLLLPIAGNVQGAVGVGVEESLLYTNHTNYYSTMADL